MARLDLANCSSLRLVILYGIFFVFTQFQPGICIFWKSIWRLALIKSPSSLGTRIKGENLSLRKAKPNPGVDQDQNEKDKDNNYEKDNDNDKDSKDHLEQGLKVKTSHLEGQNRPLKLTKIKVRI